MVQSVSSASALDLNFSCVRLAMGMHSSLAANLSRSCLEGNCRWILVCLALHVVLLADIMRRGGFMSLRIFRSSPKVSTFSALGTGILSGYYFTQISLKAYIERAERLKRLEREEPGGEYYMDRGGL